jgi:hypothetical protein
VTNTVAKDHINPINDANPETKANTELSEAAIKTIHADELDDRQIRGVLLVKAAERTNSLVMVQNDATTLWMSKKGCRFWKVEREQRNRRGKLEIEYACSCSDYQKLGRINCSHIFAERIRRGEIIIEGTVERKRIESAKAGRSPARKRITPTGRPMTSVQRDARVALGSRIPELLRDLKRLIDRQAMPTDKRDKHATSRAAALVFKIVEGKSADAMLSVYKDLIENGVLKLRKVPHQNTLSRWMNDPRLTIILEQMLTATAKPFRMMECGAIVDSSKISQMRSAHSRYVEYGDDEREQADWMKVHALVGVETLVCMAIMLSGSRGKGTHDINFIIPLVEKVRGSFNLRYILADKAYLSETVIGRLWQMGMKAVIPMKKRVEGLKMKVFYEAFAQHVEWYDNRQADFHSVYRLRPKIEGFFSLVKRVADGYCWSRGRSRRDADNKVIGNADVPCTAWVNETLCKMIYVNLRLTVQQELANGYQMNYLTDTFFPAIPEDEKLIA